MKYRVRPLFGRRHVLAGATLLAGVAAGKSLAWGQEFRPVTAATPQPAAPLPNLHLTGLDGAPVSLAAFRGKPMVLNFWATWCAPCVAELPELDALAAGGQVGVLAASTDRGGAARVKPFLASHAMAHADVVLDPGSEAAHTLQVAGFPTTLIIDARGMLRARLEGPCAWAGAAPDILKMTA